MQLTESQFLRQLVFILHRQQEYGAHSEFVELERAFVLDGVSSRQENHEWAESAATSQRTMS